MEEQIAEEAALISRRNRLIAAAQALPRADLYFVPEKEFNKALERLENAIKDYKPHESEGYIG